VLIPAEDIFWQIRGKAVILTGLFLLEEALNLLSAKEHYIRGGYF